MTLPVVTHLSFLSSSCLSLIVNAVALMLIEVSIFTTSDVPSTYTGKIRGEGEEEGGR